MSTTSQKIAHHSVESARLWIEAAQEMAKMVHQANKELLQVIETQDETYEVGTAKNKVEDRMHSLDLLLNHALDRINYALDRINNNNQSE